MSELMIELFKDAFVNRQPIACTIELTKNCNFRCLHCYITNKKDIFLEKEEVFKFVDQVVECGCLFLTLTGGECLMHPDFIEIYEYCIGKGCVVTIFTNCSLLSPKILNSFKKYPPKRIEITMYGIKLKTLMGRQRKCLL